MSEVQLNRIQFLVGEGTQAGAQILVGGKHIGECGYFYEPTVLLNTTPGHACSAGGNFPPCSLCDAI